MNVKAREEVGRAPMVSGVYLFRDAAGAVLYIGKAKTLRDRLKSYLNPTDVDRPSVHLMVAKAESVEWLVTDTEKEALLLENSLIKSHRPRYNIMFRDDKSYVSLRLTRHVYPRLFVTRKIVEDGSEYFGPYSSASDLRETLHLIQRLFLIRDCTDPFFNNRSRPCLRYQIKRCSAPCVGKVAPEAYADSVDQVRLFLSGNRAPLVRELSQEMENASSEMRFEDAARIRDRLKAVGETLEAQKVESRRESASTDVIGLSGDSDATLIKVLKVRGGRVEGAEEFFIAEPLSAAPEILHAFFEQHYLDAPANRPVPQRFLLPFFPPDGAILSDLLQERKGHAVEFVVPRRGRGAKLLRLAERNAALSLSERKRRSEKMRQVLTTLREKLSLKAFPRRIEGYDISSFHGAEPIGAHVVFIEGEPDKNFYRQYRIRSVKGSNDFAMLKEMFERRFKRLTSENRPDLVLVDGGRGQLRQMIEVLRALGIEGTIDVASIAKEKAIVSRSGKRYAPERIYLPGQKNAIVFPGSSPVLHLLMRVRDEAHRFGITRHRASRGKRTISSLLDRIPGIGPKRQRALLKHFGSVEAIRGAGVEELAICDGISMPAARAVFDFFRAAKADSDE